MNGSAGFALRAAGGVKGSVDIDIPIGSAGQNDFSVFLFKGLGLDNAVHIDDIVYDAFG